MAEIDEQSIYRECFTTPAGKIVLANLMAEAKMFRLCKTPEEVAVNNFMKMVLYKLGIYCDDNEDLIVRVLLDIQPRIRRKTEVEDGMD